jgi:hypothetical protein
VVQEIADLLDERGVYMKLTKRHAELLTEHAPETLQKLKALVEEWPEERVSQLGTIFGFNIKKYNLVVAVASVGSDVRKMYSPDSYKDAIEDVVNVCNQLQITQMDTEPGDYHFSLIKADVIGRSIYLASPFRALIPHQQAMFTERIRTNIDVLEPAAPVIAAIGTLTGEDEAGPSFEEMMDVAELVAKHPGQAENIAQTIIERGEYDPELIEQMFTSASPAVSSGIL